MNSNMTSIEKNYLTDNIFLLNKKLFYEDNNKIKEVKNHNWHHILSDYGWEKLPKQWIKKLNSYLNVPKKNSQFGTLDCGGDGDCLFHCISYAIDNHDAKSLRKEISETIKEERYNEIIEVYKVLKEADDFDEDWDPNSMTYDKFINILITGGHFFWGDFLILNLIKEYLDINIVILNSNEITNEYHYYPLFYEYNELHKTIILLYENEMHFKLIGNFQNGEMIYYFTHQTVPYEILKIINYLR